MIPQDLITYTDAEIERKAQECLRVRVDVTQSRYIKIEKLIERHQDVAHLKVDPYLSVYDVEGCVCKRGNARNLTVLVDKKIANGPIENYYAVLAEEFAHINLHMAVIELIKDLEDFLEVQRDPKWAELESDARKFSLSLRMPIPMVTSRLEEKYRLLVLEKGFSNSFEFDLFTETARSLRVPRQDLIDRINWRTLLPSRIQKSIQTSAIELLEHDSEVVAIKPHERIVQKNLFEWLEEIRKQHQ